MLRHESLDVLVDSVVEMMIPLTLMFLTTRNTTRKNPYLWIAAISTLDRGKNQLLSLLYLVRCCHVILMETRPANLILQLLLHRLPFWVISKTLKPLLIMHHHPHSRLCMHKRLPVCLQALLTLLTTTPLVTLTILCFLSWRNNS